MLQRTRPLLLLPLLACLLTACSGAGTGGAKPPPSPEPVREKPATAVGGTRRVAMEGLGADDRAEMEAAWRLFVDRDPRWSRARGDWIAKGAGARTVLAENLFRYFWSASTVMKKDEVLRVGQEAAFVPEEATLLFADLLALDKWPLRESTTALVFNPDNATRPASVKVTHLAIDDVTRQNAAMVLALIGPAAVPTLASPPILGAPRPSSRTYALYALGTIGDDAAVRALAGVLAGGGDWKDRGAAAKALGFALGKNPAARVALERALTDPDAFVRKKTQEALDGKSRWEV